MRVQISFPGPLRLDLCLGGALVLLALQLVTGTSVLFAELTFLAVTASVLAVNMAGGLRTVAGCCFAVMAAQVFIVAEIAKACLGEPGESNLEVPMATMGVMALSMTSLSLGALACCRLKPKRILFRPLLDPQLLKVITVISFIIGFASLMCGQVAGQTDDGAVQLGGIAGVLRRFSGCLPLSVIAGTAYSLLASKNTRLFSIYNLGPLLIQVALGIFYSSKEGMFEPVLCLLFTAAAFRYSFRPAQLVLGGSATLFAIFVLFPFGQVARNYTRGVNLADTFHKNVDYLRENLKNPRYFLDNYEEYQRGLEAEDSLFYFNKPNGLLERMALIKPADALVHATMMKGTSGWQTILPGVMDLIPRDFLPRRWVNVPNQMGYKAGYVEEDNTGTCISFGFAADAYGAFGWLGVAIIPGLLAGLIIAITRFVTPSIPQNIWGVFFFVAYQHIVAEAHAGGVLGIFTTQTAWLVLSLGVVLYASRLWLVLLRNKGLIRPGTNSIRPSLPTKAIDLPPCGTLAKN